MTPEPAWRVTALLCDSAQVADGKLYVLGGGWSVCGPGPFLHGITLKVEVPWNEANKKHSLTADLIHQDGRTVEVGDPPEEIRFGTEFEVGRPPGLLPASSMDFPLAINFGPMELPPGEMYAWRIVIDKTEVDRVNFQTRKHP